MLEWQYRQSQGKNAMAKFKAIGISHPNYPHVRGGASHGKLDGEFTVTEVEWDGKLEDVFAMIPSLSVTRYIIWSDGKIVMDGEANEGDDMMDELLDDLDDALNDLELA